MQKKPGAQACGPATYYYDFKVSIQKVWRLWLMFLVWIESFILYEAEVFRLANIIFKGKGYWGRNIVLSQR